MACWVSRRISPTVSATCSNEIPVFRDETELLALTPANRLPPNQDSGYLVKAARVAQVSSKPPRLSGFCSRVIIPKPWHCPQKRENPPLTATQHLHPAAPVRTLLCPVPKASSRNAQTGIADIVGQTGSSHYIPKIGRLETLQPVARDHLLPTRGQATGRCSKLPRLWVKRVRT